MTAKTLMFEGHNRQLTRVRDQVRTQRFKNDEIRRKKISQIVHSAIGFDYYEILQTAKT